MVNSLFYKFILLLLFVFSCSSMYAQKVARGTVVRSYAKVSSDSVRPRNVVVKKRKPIVGVEGNTLKKKKSVKTKVDSLELQPLNYRLGERVIMRGDSGRDVRSLAKVLVNKLYIDEASLVYTANGGVLYEEGLIKAVKLFQEFNGLPVDGVVGKEVVKALRRRK